MLKLLLLSALMVPNINDAKLFSKDPIGFWITNNCEPFLVLQPATEKEIIAATICKNTVGIMHGYGDIRQRDKTLFLLNKIKVQIELMLLIIIKDNELGSNPEGRWLNHLSMKGEDRQADIWIWVRVK